MASPTRNGSIESTDANIRKRVCKACDRCRLKKSKCDGQSPCSRCKTDNAICVFGERKKSHDKVYPKGYVEMLEQQQGQLVAGLQDMYRRLQRTGNWPGSSLTDGPSGQPLTHDILAGLDLLHPTEDGAPQLEGFEEDLGRLQQRLFENGAPIIGRRSSFSSESEQDHEHHVLSPASRGTSTATTPASAPAHQTSFSYSFARNSAPMTPPLSKSPASRAAQINTNFKTSSNPPISGTQPSVIHPSALQGSWIPPADINSNPSFEESLNTIDLEGFVSYDFGAINLETGMNGTTQGMVGFNNNGLLMSDFVNDATEMELSNFMPQPVT